MRRFDHPILQRIQELGAPKPSDIVITHGSALAVYGVRDENPQSDIDLVTSQENIDYFLTVLHWRTQGRTTGHDAAGLPKIVARVLSPDNKFDVYLHDFVAKWFRERGKGRVYLPQLKELSEQDEATGIWVATPDFVRLTKEGSTRQKDIDDIAHIDAYLQKRGSRVKKP